MSAQSNTAGASITEFVTVTIGGHLFGLPIARVQDVFVPDRLTRVPLAPPEVAGILNLRGRVVTAIDMRSRLDLGAQTPGQPVMAIGGFNGTDPSPTLEEFQHYVVQGQIHYFVRGKMMLGHWGRLTGSSESTDIAEWVETHYTPQTIDRVLIYDLTQPPRNS